MGELVQVERNGTKVEVTWNMGLTEHPQWMLWFEAHKDVCAELLVLHMRTQLHQQRLANYTAGYEMGRRAAERRYNRRLARMRRLARVVPGRCGRRK